MNQPANPSTIKQAKYKLFTHDDLDGVSCHVLANLAFGEDNVDVTYCSYKNVDEHVQEFYKSGRTDQYARIFITDISVNKETAALIDSMPPSTQPLLIDHHETALWLNEYVWAVVFVKDETGKRSGTDLFFPYLSAFHMNGKINDSMAYYVEMVRQYDTWEWKEKYQNEVPKQLNRLFMLSNRDKFVARFTERLKKNDKIFNTSETFFLRTEELRITQYIEKKIEQLEIANVPTTIRGLRFGIVFAEQYISELGNAICDVREDIDIAVIIDMGSKTISYRTTREDINLAEIAKACGGGGHQKAAGNPMKESVYATINQFLDGLIIPEGAFSKKTKRSND